MPMIRDSAGVSGGGTRAHGSDHGQAQADGEPQKTRVCRVPEEPLSLGYALGDVIEPDGTRLYGTRVAKKRVKRLCEEISQLTRRTTVGQEAGEMVGASTRNGEDGPTTSVLVR